MNKSNKCPPQNVSSQKFFVAITAVVNWRWISLSATHLTRLYLYFIAIYEQIYLFNRLSFKTSISLISSYVYSNSALSAYEPERLPVHRKQLLLIVLLGIYHGNHDKSYIENTNNKDLWTCAKKLLKYSILLWNNQWKNITFTRGHSIYHGYSPY